jgi:hypothetical protein
LSVNEINGLADCDFWKSTIFAANTELSDVFTQSGSEADSQLTNKTGNFVRIAAIRQDGKYF